MPDWITFALIFTAVMGFVAGRLYAEMTVISALQRRINDLQRISWGNKCDKEKSQCATRKKISTAYQEDGFVSVTYEDDNA